MKLIAVCCTLCALISSTSANREFDRTFQMLRKRAVSSVSEDAFGTTSTILQPVIRRAMPSLTASSSSSSSTGNSSTTASSSSSSSSYSATFTPVVPNAAGNKSIYHTEYPSGTVFVIVGAVIGFLGVLFTLIWAISAVRAWLSARREYRARSVEARFQSDPFMFQSKDTDTEYSDGSSHSDVSETILKTRSSRRPALRTFGSQSTVDLLQGKTISVNTISPAERNSMFISPTEIMKNSANGHGLPSQGTPQSEFSEFSGPVQAAQVLEHSDPLYQFAYGEPRSVRPPSIHLEKMFDEEL
ncbi:LAFA_0F02234g1_1 [Lachancea sp. 'fantastica']|nr:LAFA_0F02234g1_1 [Lachancea sp. 'fantastica']